MAIRNISISEIIERYKYGFGYVAANVAEIAANRIWSNLVDIPVFEEPNSQFANLSLENSRSGNKYSFGLENGGVTDNYIAPPPMLSFYRDKKVVVTPIDRSEIEVIEEFGLRPFDIRFEGIIIDTEEHQYPGALLREVNSMFSEPGTFKVVSDIFNDLNITEIFFYGGFDIRFLEGFVDTIRYSVRAFSTQPAEFKSKDN